MFILLVNLSLSLCFSHQHILKWKTIFSLKIYSVVSFHHEAVMEKHVFQLRFYL